jgi:hypothetical protein
MISGTAGGDINPSRFLKRSTTADAKWLQCTANSDKIAGISQVGTRYPAALSLDDGKAAIAGENIHVYLAGRDKEAPLEYGGTVTAGDLLTSDSSGRGVTGTTGQQVGARALFSGILGQVMPVEPLWGDVT